MWSTSCPAVTRGGVMAAHITHNGCSDSQRARRSCPLRPVSRAGASGRLAHALRSCVISSFQLIEVHTSRRSRVCPCCRWLACRRRAIGQPKGFASTAPQTVPTTPASRYAGVAVEVVRHVCGVQYVPVDQVGRCWWVWGLTNLVVRRFLFFTQGPELRCHKCQKGGFVTFVTALMGLLQ
jgi:hypothetical protein